jgi:DNA-binding IclR family transcriptional regulator
VSSGQKYRARAVKRANKSRLRKEHARAREQGYAFDDEEMTRGVRCVAAPIFVFPGQVAAAIGIVGPAVRISRQMLERLAKPLVVSVRQLSGRLAPTWGASTRHKWS